MWLESIAVTHRRAILLLLCGVVFIMGLIGYIAHSWRSAKLNPPIPSISFSSLDVGETVAKSDFQWTVHMTNESLMPIEIIDFDASCDCTIFTPRQFRLAPGEAKAIRLTIDLSGRAGSVSPLDVRFSPVLKDRYSGPSPFWQLTGRVVSPCVLDRYEASFSGALALIQGSKSNEASFRAKLHDKNLKLAVTTSDPRDRVRIANDRGDDFTQITLMLASDRPLGWFETELEIRILASDGDEWGTMIIRVNGEVVPPFDIFPHSIALGTLPIGTTVEESITVDSSQGVLLDAAPLVDEVTVELKPESHQTIVIIRFSIDRIDANIIPIHLIYRRKSGDVVTAIANILYSGFEPKSVVPLPVSTF